MLNDEQKLSRVKGALKALSDGHIDVNTFTVTVASIVDPGLHNDTLFVIRQRARERSKQAGQHNTACSGFGTPCPDCGGELWDWYCVNCHTEHVH